jgi:hypothetical protein
VFLLHCDIFVEICVLRTPQNWGIPNRPPTFSRPFARQVVQIELELSPIAPRLQLKKLVSRRWEARADGLWADRNPAFGIDSRRPKYKD